MGQLIRPNQVRVITKDGEIAIQLVLDININLNQSGGLTVAVQNEGTKVVREQRAGEVTHVEKEDDDKAEWEIPDFSTISGLNFGKTVKEGEQE